MHPKRPAQSNPRLLALLLIGLVCLGGLLFWLHQREQAEILRQLSRQQEQLAELATDRIEQLLGGLQGGLYHLSEDRRALSDIPGRIPQRLAQLYHRYPPDILLGLCVKDAQGKILVQYPPNRLDELGLSAQLLPALRPETPHPDPRVLAGRSVLMLADPFRPENQPFAELAALISLDALLAASLPVSGPEPQPCFLLDGSGVFIYHSNPRFSGRPFSEAVLPGPDPELFRALNAMAHGERATVRIPSSATAAAVSGGAKGPVLLSYVPLNIPGANWALAMALPPKALAAIEDSGLPFHITIAAALCLIALLAWLLLELTGRAHRLARENSLFRRENQHLQGAFERSERRCRHLLENAGDAIFFIDPETGGLREINRRAEELLGYSADEIRMLSLSVLFPGRQQRRYLRLVKNVLNNGYGEDGSLLFRSKSGRLFPGAVHARLGDLGEEQVVHGVLRDVTEIKRIEHELRQRNRDLTLVNEISNRAAGTRNLQEMLGIILQEVIGNFEADGGGIYLMRHEGTSLNLLVHQGISEDIVDELRQLAPGQGLAGRVAASGRPRSSANLQRDRRLRSQAVRLAGWRGFQAVPLTATEKTVGVLFVFNSTQRLFSREEINLLLAIGSQVGTAVEGAELFDALQWQYRLTQASNRELEQSRQQLRSNLESLEEANRKLEQLDQMKSNFLAMASHELRTPLTYVLSGTELLQSGLEGRVSAEEVRILDAIYQGGQRLERIVQDLLEVARVESQNIHLAQESVNLPLLMEDIGREFQPLFEKRGITFRAADIPWPLSLRGDTQHLGKTFRRLVENAAKFTPRGGRIEIGATLKEPSDILAREDRLRPFSPGFFKSPPATPLLQVTVQDNGIGINPDDHVKVFDKFFEVGDITGHFTSQTRFGGKGVGLGLALVRGVVEAHGGMVWVESPGTGLTDGGSAFHVLLPLADKLPAPPGTEARPRGIPALPIQ